MSPQQNSTRRRLDSFLGLRPSCALVARDRVGEPSSDIASKGPRTSCQFSGKVSSLAALA